VGPREFEEGRDQMVYTRSMMNEKMLETEQMMLMMSLWREMDEMKKKNEEEMLALRRENEEKVDRGRCLWRARQPRWET